MRFYRWRQALQECYSVFGLPLRHDKSIDVAHYIADLLPIYILFRRSINCTVSENSRLGPAYNSQLTDKDSHFPNLHDDLIACALHFQEIVALLDVVEKLF